MVSLSGGRLCPEGAWKGDDSDIPRSVISDAKRPQTGSLNVKIDLCQGSYGPRV